MASFILFLIVMKLAFFDPIKNIIQTREKAIAANLSKSHIALGKFGESAENENPVHIIRRARLEAQEIISKAVSESNKERQEMVNRELKNIKNNTGKGVIELEKETRGILMNLDEHVAQLSKEALNKLMSELNAHATA